MVQTLNRRDRVRAATTTEIKQTARRILVSEGPDAVSLRAIAREMGMTAPALYRYFGSHEELIKHVIADIFTELTADLQAESERDTPPTAPAELPDGLSAREVEVLRLIAAGESNREIGEALFISVNTVVRHVAHIFAKTGCANRVEATRYATRHGLVP